MAGARGGDIDQMRRQRHDAGILTAPRTLFELVEQSIERIAAIGVDVDDHGAEGRLFAQPRQCVVQR